MRLCPHCLADIDNDPGLPENGVYSVLAAVEAVTGVPPSGVLSPTRTARIVSARKAAASVLRDKFCLSYTELGAVFDRDHTTMIHAVRTADPQVVGRVRDVMRERNRDARDAATGTAA